MSKTEQELEQIKTELVAKYGKVYTVTIPVDEDETETRTIYLKKFDRVTLAAVQKMAAGSDSLKAIEVFIKNTFVGGDDMFEVLNDFDMLRSLESVVIDLISVKKATLKKN